VNKLPEDFYCRCLKWKFIRDVCKKARFQIKFEQTKDSIAERTLKHYELNTRSGTCILTADQLFAIKRNDAQCQSNLGDARKVSAFPDLHQTAFRVTASSLSFCCGIGGAPCADKSNGARKMALTDDM
jgi:hypothetical protein